MRKSNPGARRNLTHIASRMFDVPLMMHPRKLRSIIGVMGMEMGLASAFSPDIVASAEDDFLTVHSHACIPAGCGISVIPVQGTLVQRGDSLDAMSGLRSYDAIRADLREALADAGTDSILLDFDSGGGEVAGLFDLVDEVAAADKPVYAFVNENAYSAAYALASAADKIYVARTGGVGSIGIVAVHVDQSAFDKEKGFSYTPIFAGARKVDGWAHAPLSDEARAEFQASVDRSYGIFVETVARNRGISEKSVRGTEAACFTAEDAIQNGLADGIASFDDMIEIIAQDLQNSTALQGFPGQGGREAFSGPSGDHSATKGPQDMTRKLLKGKQPGKDDPAADDEAARKAALAQEPGKKGNGDTPEKGKKEPAGDDQEDEVDGGVDEDEEDDKEKDKAAKNPPAAAAPGLSAGEAADISDLCVLYGQPNLASGFIRKGMGVDAVRRHLLKQRNEDAETARVNNGSVNSAHSDKSAENATLADMKRRYPAKK